MRNLTTWTLTTAPLLLLPVLVSAGSITTGEAGDFGKFIGATTELVNDFLIPFFIALCVLAFIYGVFTYFIAGGGDEEKRAQGRSLMLYAILGFVAIVALWAIVNFVVNAFGFNKDAGPIDVGGVNITQ